MSGNKEYRREDKKNLGQCSLSPGILVFLHPEGQISAESVCRSHTEQPQFQTRECANWLTRPKNQSTRRLTHSLWGKQGLMQDRMFLPFSAPSPILVSSKWSGYMQWWLELFHNYFSHCRLMCTLGILERDLILKILKLKPVSLQPSLFICFSWSVPNRALRSITH